MRGQRGLDAGGADGGQRLEDAGHDPLVRIVEHRGQAAGGRLGIDLPHGAGHGPPHAPVRIRPQPRQHAQEGLGIGGREGAQRGGAERRPRMRHELREYGDRRLTAVVREGVDGLQPEHAVEVADAHEAVELGRGGRIVDRAEGADGADDDAVVAAVAIEERRERPDGPRIAERPEPARGEGDADGAANGGQRREGVEGARVRDLLQRIGHGPPPEDRLPVLEEDGLGQRLVLPEAGQRVDPEPERLDLVVQRIRDVLRIDVEGGGTVPLDERADGAGRRRVAEAAERLRRAPPHLRRWILEGEPERSRGRGVADEPQGERRHQPHLGLRLGRLETARERLHGVGEPDPAEGEGGAPPDAGAGIVEVGDELRLAGGRRSGRRGRRGGGVGAGPAGAGAAGTAGTGLHVAQDAPVLEAQDGRELLVRRRRDRRCRRRPCGGAGAGGAESAQEEQAGERPGRERRQGNAGGMAAGIGRDHCRAPS